MSDRYIEKLFLYLTGLSLLLHLAAIALISHLPQEKKPAPQQPVMVDLQDLPPAQKPPARSEEKARRQAEEKRRFPREMAPRGDMTRELPPRALTRPVPPQREARLPSRPTEKGGAPVLEPRGESLLKPRRSEPADMAKLFPSAGKMASLEDAYRKKYGPEVEEGEARFLNTDDIQFGSFLRRFESAVYGVWRYPHEAAMMGIEGVTPVRITFNRKGEIVDYVLLESSGSRILDEEVRRTLRAIGPVGGFPKGYDKETFNLIAFFQYGIIRGMSRGTLH